MDPFVTRPKHVLVAVPIAAIVALAVSECGSSGGSGSGGAGTSSSEQGPGPGPGPGPGTMSSTTSTGAGGSVNAGASVLQYHKNATRDGVTVDAAITKASAATMHIDSSFNAAIDGQVYAQPLFVDGRGSDKDMVLVATEKNNVYEIGRASCRERV